MTIDLRYPTPLPDTKGWGPGWPNCDTSKIVPDPIFQGGLNKGISELVSLLVTHIEAGGFKFHDGWSWGYGCRATKGGSGDTPSFHSWGLALDVNAPENVFGGAASGSDINVNNHWIVPLLADYGFFWLGPAIGDWMHFSFAGSPADAVAMTIKARAAFGGPGKDELMYADFKKGWKGYRAGGPEPTKDGDEKFGWEAARFASENPAPKTPGAHTHQVSGTAT